MRMFVWWGIALLFILTISAPIPSRDILQSIAGMSSNGPSASDETRLDPAGELMSYFEKRGQTMEREEAVRVAREIASIFRLLDETARALENH